MESVARWGRLECSTGRLAVHRGVDRRCLDGSARTPHHPVNKNELSCRAGNIRAASAHADNADVDAVIAIGGTGVGRDDASVATLARLGRVEVHGIALSPGETAAGELPQ